MPYNLHELKIPHDGRYKVDGTFYLTPVGGTDLSATLIYTSAGGSTVTCGSSSLAMPTGSFQVKLPTANPRTGQTEGRFARTVSWTATMELSGSRLFSGSALPTNLNLRVVPLTHNTLSGTYNFCIVAASGTTVGSDTVIRMVPALPTDTLRISWSIEGRNDPSIR